MSQASGSIQRKLARATAALRAGELVLARDLCVHLLSTHGDNDAPWVSNAFLLLSRVLQRDGDYPGMLEAAQKANIARPRNIEVRLRLAECQLLNGAVAEALDGVRALESSARDRKGALLRIGGFYAQCGQVTAAYRCQVRALQLEPDDPESLYALAQSSADLGEFAQAEKLYDRLIYLQPDDYDAWHNRSLLRRQSLENHHIKEMSFALDSLEPEDPDRIPLAYALAKEWDDIDHYDEAFHFVQLGARARFERLNYAVQTDIQNMELLRKIFNQQWFAEQDLAKPVTRCGVDNGSGPPVILLGLPCSGVEFAERLLARHDALVATGDNNLLPITLMRQGEAKEGRLDLEGLALDANPEALGLAYDAALRGLRSDANARPIDATLANFLYLPLLRRALPDARVIHLRRIPMDNAFQLYRTLFRKGVFYSYRMEDIARYMRAYEDLLAHWRTIMPGWFMDVDYERLVAGDQQVLDELLAFLGVEPNELWVETTAALRDQSSDLLQDHDRQTINRWKSYRKQLAPLQQLMKDLSD